MEKNIDQEKVAELKNKLAELETIKENIQTEKSKFEESITDLVDNKKEVEDSIFTLKSEIESEAVKLFEETKEKKYYGGIGVQERTELEYDEAVALNWAMEKKMFLQLDKKGFEKAVPSINVDFVKSKKVPKATFPKEIKLEE